MVLRRAAVLPPPPAPGAAPAAPGAAAQGTQDGTVVIGVAIPVPAPHADELQRWRADFGDPLAWAIPAHVTLVPPTPVGAGALDEVRAHLRECTSSVPPFEMRLAGTSTFRPVTPVVYVRVAQGAGECARLEQQVRSGILGVQRRFPFHPHVTVAHELDDAALDRASTTLAGYRAAFDVREVQLYQHCGDGVWRPVADFPLGPG